MNTDKMQLIVKILDFMTTSAPVFPAIRPEKFQVWVENSTTTTLDNSPGNSSTQAVAFVHNREQALPAPKAGDR